MTGPDKTIRTTAAMLMYLMDCEHWIDWPKDITVDAKKILIGQRIDRLAEMIVQAGWAR